MTEGIEIAGHVWLKAGLKCENDESDGYLVIARHGDGVAWERKMTK